MAYKTFGLYGLGRRSTALKIVKCVVVKSKILNELEILHGNDYVNNLEKALQTINYEVYKNLSDGDKADFRMAVADEIYKRSLILPNPLITALGGTEKSDPEVKSISIGFSDKYGIGYNKISSDSKKIVFPDNLMEVNLLTKDIETVISGEKFAELQPSQVKLKQSTGCVIL